MMQSLIRSCNPILQCRQRLEENNAHVDVCTGILPFLFLFQTLQGSEYRIRMGFDVLYRIYMQLMRLMLYFCETIL